MVVRGRVRVLSVLVVLSLVWVADVFGGGSSVAEAQAASCVVGDLVQVTSGLGPSRRLEGAISGDGSTVAYFRETGATGNSLSTTLEVGVAASDGSGEQVVGGLGRYRSVVLSGDGSVMAVERSGGFLVPSTVLVFDRDAAGVFVPASVATYSNASRPTLSVDGSKLTYAAQGVSVGAEIATDIVDLATGTVVSVATPYQAVSGDARHVAYRVAGETVVQDLGTSAVSAGYSGADPELSDDGKVLVTDTSAGLQVHDRDVDGDDIFDEPGDTTTTLLLVTGDNQTRDGTLYSWSINKHTVSGDGSKVTLAVETGDHNYESFIETVDVASDAVVATGAIDVDQDPVEQLSTTSDGLVTVFALREPIATGDSNGQTDLNAFAIVPCPLNLDVAVGAALPADVASNADFVVPIEIANTDSAPADLSGFTISIDGPAVASITGITAVPNSIAPGAAVTVLATVTAVETSTDTPLDINISLRDQAGAEIVAAQASVVVQPPMPVIAFSSALPGSVLSGEEIQFSITVINTSLSLLETSNLAMKITGDGVSEVLIAPEFASAGPQPTAGTVPIAAQSSVTRSATIRAARETVDMAARGVTIELVDTSSGLEVPLASATDAIDVAARPKVDVHFTLAQLVGCEQEEPVSALCEFGGPDGAGDDGEYIVRVRFEDQHESVFSGEREEFGDFNERMFFFMSEEVIPTSDTISITLEAFDDDDEEALFAGAGASIAGASIGAADQQIDLSPNNDELTATIEYDPATGSWRVDGATTDPGTDRVHHWTRGDGDYDMSTGTGHPGLVSFDISSLAPLPTGVSGDRDGDGLLDGWEMFGLHLLPMSRTTPLNPGELPRSSSPVTGPDTEYAVLDRSWTDAAPDVNSPDLYVENDWLSNGTTEIQPADRPKNGHTYQTILDSFDAGRGIDLWIDAAAQAGNGAFDLGGSGVIELSTVNAIELSANVAYVCNVNSDEFNQVKDIGFNVNRRWVFRYGLTGDQPIFTIPPAVDCGSGGTAEVGGNDLLMLRRDALVFMHELGHNLGLRHGGFEADNCKPNYVSVMNYWYDNTNGILTASGDYIYDFAPAALTGSARPQNGPLNESTLNETTAPNLSNNEHIMRFINGAGVESGRLLSQPQDYNGDFDFVDNSVAVDLDTRPSTKGCEPSPGETLNSHNDWMKITLSFRDHGASADGAELDIPDDSQLDPTEAEVLAFNQAFARVDVAASLDGTYNPATSLFNLNATVIGVDSPLVVQPAVSFVLDPGVTLVGSPPECVAVTTALVECVLDTIVADTTPTPPTSLSLQFSLNAGASAGVVTATATSQDNPIDNDPDATNNTAQLDLAAVVGSAPVAVDDEALVLAGDAIDIDVLGNDTDVDEDLDPGSLQITGAPQLGTAEVTNAGDGPMITYTAGPNSGTDTLDYQICDLAGNCDQAIVTIEIMGASDCTIVGTSADDILTGTEGDDVICARGGNDVVDARGGNDVVFGGRGADTIDGGSGDDRLVGGRGADIIHGGPDNDWISGNRGDDTITGGSGADEIHGNRGDDDIEGGNNDDLLLGGRGKDTIRGGEGNDTIYGGKHADDLRGNAGNDTIFGRRGADTIRGGKGNDTLFGNRGADLIVGGQDADVFFGGKGKDECTIDTNDGPDPTHNCETINDA